MVIFYLEETEDQLFRVFKGRNENQPCVPPRYTPRRDAGERSPTIFLVNEVGGVEEACYRGPTGLTAFLCTSNLVRGNCLILRCENFLSVWAWLHPVREYLLSIFILQNSSNRVFCSLWQMVELFSWGYKWFLIRQENKFHVLRVVCFWLCIRIRPIFERFRVNPFCAGYTIICQLHGFSLVTCGHDLLHFNSPMHTNALIKRVKRLTIVCVSSWTLSSSAGSRCYSKLQNIPRSPCIV